MSMLDAMATFERGVAALQRQELEQALGYFKDSSTRNPSFVDVWVAIGLCEFWLGKTSIALYALNEAIRLQPSCAEAYTIRSELYGELERWDDAAHDAWKARHLSQGMVSASTVVFGGKHFPIASPNHTCKRGQIGDCIDIDQSAAAIVTARAMIQGSWELAAMRYDGVSVEEGVGQLVEIIGRQVHMTTARPNETSVDTFNLDPTTDPTRIDLFNNGEEGVPQRGIYRLEENILTMCSSSPNHERPRIFHSPRGKGHVLLILKRIQKTTRAPN